MSQMQQQQQHHHHHHQQQRQSHVAAQWNAQPYDLGSWSDEEDEDMAEAACAPMTFAPGAFVHEEHDYLDYSSNLDSSAASLPPLEWDSGMPMSPRMPPPYQPSVPAQQGQRAFDDLAAAAGADFDITRRIEPSTGLSALIAQRFPMPTADNVVYMLGRPLPNAEYQVMEDAGSAPPASAPTSAVSSPVPSVADKTSPSPPPGGEGSNRYDGLVAKFHASYRGSESPQMQAPSPSPQPQQPSSQSQQSSPQPQADAAAAPRRDARALKWHQFKGP